MEDTKSRSYGGLIFGAALGAACGALAMYYLDPQRGRTRRALVKDKVFSLNHRVMTRTEQVAMNLKNRMYGKFQELKHRRQAAQVDDEILLLRVRSAIGRRVSHLKALHIYVNNGEVSLSGPVLKQEVPGLIKVVEHIPGVSQVIDDLSKYDPSEIIPDLQ
jgi:osmotically-inducible protein OsmY